MGGLTKAPFKFNVSRLAWTKWYPWFSLMALRIMSSRNAVDNFSDARELAQMIQKLANAVRRPGHCWPSPLAVPGGLEQ